jgi:hypothetical protein
VQAEKEIPLWLYDDAGKPVARRFDALVVIQPSKMAPIELEHLLDAINQGQPTAIFEDPFTYCFRESNPMAIFQGTHPPYNENNLPARFPGTSLPRPIDRLGREPGDIQKLWDALGIYVMANKVQGEMYPMVVWKTGNPYPRNRADARNFLSFTTTIRTSPTFRLPIRRRRGFLSCTFLSGSD